MRALFAFVAVVLVACGAPKAPEESPLGDVDALDKDDSFAKPTEHGAIAFGARVVESFDAKAQYHAWTFALSGAGSVAMKTAYGGRGTPDTVVYLYRRAANGRWGGYLAKNDDASATSTWSSLTRALTAGEYRVIVKGYSAREVGRFALTVDCSGAGCAPAAPACLFGSTYGELVDSTGPVRVTGRTTLHLADAATLSAIQGAQLVRALHASTHTDVTTVAEAFAAADQGEINYVRVWDEAGSRSFVAVEYGAGDNSYGALFPESSADAVAEIHDGDLLSCMVKAETCLFGPTFHALRTGTAFVVESQKVLTASSTLSALESAQLLAAVRESNSDVATVAEAITAVDEDQVNQVGLRDAATGQRFTAYEYGAGDSSYGAIFVAGTTTRAAAIHDGDHYGCAVFR